MTGSERPVPRPLPLTCLRRTARPPAQRRRHNCRIGPVNLISWLKGKAKEHTIVPKNTLDILFYIVTGLVIMLAT